MSTRYTPNFDGANPFSDINLRVALQQNVLETFTVPGEQTTKYRAEFFYNYSANIFVGLNENATVPAAGTIDSTGKQAYRPAVKYVLGGDELTFITPDTSAYFGVELFTIPG